MEPDFARVLPDEVCCHFTRAWYNFRPDPDDPRPADPLPELANDTVRAVPLLADAGATAVTSGSTAGSFFDGPTFDSELIRRMEAAAPGIRATTPSTAVAHALRALGVTRVSVATPYLKDLNDREVLFLEYLGFTVDAIAGLGITHGRDMAYVPSGECDQFVREHVAPGSQACFVSCTNFPVLPLIADWERDFGIPVVTSNQATLWMLLRMVGWTEPVRGYGQLLATMPEVPTMPEWGSR